MSSEEYKKYMYDICNTSWRSEITAPYCQIQHFNLLDVPEYNIFESSLLFLKKR